MTEPIRRRSYAVEETSSTSKRQNGKDDSKSRARSVMLESNGKVKLSMIFFGIKIFYKAEIMKGDFGPFSN